MKRNSSKTKPGSNRDGFTLVELVVVIAVLAILAGVGAVAYNGYIEYAKKGVDRQTVGEIMHALELADYADPGLFGDDAGAMVVLSTDGINGAGGREDANTTINEALEDAFGDRTSTKLSFDNWKGTADMSVFEALGAEDSKVMAYLNATADGGEASFARDIDELWEAVQDTLDKMGTTGTNRMQRVVRLSNKLQEEILTRWKGKQSLQISDPSIKKEDGATDTVAWMGASHSRNYAFYMYARSHCDDWNDTMQKEIDALLNLRGGVAYYDATQQLKDGRWQALIDSYLDSNDGTSQAEIDAMAYLGMMEAAAAVGDKKGDGGYVGDDDYLSAFQGYVGMVGNILTSSKEYFQKIKDLANSVATKGNVIVINATKLSNGTLKFSVSPEEATPREKEVVEVINYTKNNAVFTFTSGVSDMTSEQTVFLEPNKSVTIMLKYSSGTNLDLTPSSNPYKQTDITPGLTATFSGSSVTITSDGTAIANGKIVFSRTITFPSASTQTITINVVVK